MKIGLAQIRPIKGDIQNNIIAHIKLIELAVLHDADVIVFPELSLTGYEPTLAKSLATHQDDERFTIFQDMSNANTITIGVGVPTKQENGICISMILFQPQKSAITYSKRYLHDDELPFFTCGSNFPVLKVKGVNIALAICYELSIPEHVEHAFKNGAEVYLASVAKSVHGVEKANISLTEIARKYSMTVLMSNSIGESEGFESCGQSAIWNRSGAMIAQLNESSEGIIIIDIETGALILKTI